MAATDTLLLPILLLLGCLAEMSLSIECMTCIADSNNLLKCTRDEYQGTYIKCPEDNNVPVNTCYKSVHKITGEVNKGCAPDPRNKNSVYVSEEGPWGEIGVTSYYCNTRLCNSAPATSLALGSLLSCVLATLLARRLT